MLNPQMLFRTQKRHNFGNPKETQGRQRKATSNAPLPMVRFGPLCALICPPCVPIACSHRTLKMFASDVLVAVGIQSCANLQPLQIVFQLCAGRLSRHVFFFLAPPILKSPCFQGHVKVRLERGTFCFFCCLSAGHMSFSCRVSYWGQGRPQHVGPIGIIVVFLPVACLWSLKQV